MHMADALLSPQVGAVMWGATGITAAYCAKKVREEASDSTIPLMGVAGAFVFAAQMLNFSIPGTGSSGHIGGGLLLAVLLGPHAAFLVMASVLGVQALFFGDGGLLALGANVFNLGLFPAFVAYPLVYRRVVRDRPNGARLVVGALLAAVIGLQLGAFGVVLETTRSGVSSLPFGAFAALMQPIHLAIGVVEGLVTAGVLAFVARAEPELLARGQRPAPLRRLSPVLIGLLVAAIVAGGFLARFASTNPDGLEWAIERVTGSAQIDAPPSATHQQAAEAQGATAIMPDYTAPGQTGDSPLPGVVGGLAVLGVVAGAGVVFRRRSRSLAH